MRWALFFLGEYVHVFVGSAFFVTLFMGGWSLNPFTAWDLPAAGGILMVLLQFGVVLVKIFFLIFMTMMVRWTLPRFRFDQIMRLAWEGMIPTSLLLVLIVSFWVYLDWTAWLWTGSAVALIIMLVVGPRLPSGGSNRRVALHGSRFSAPS